MAERVMRSIAAEFNLPVCGSYSIFQRLAEEDGPENVRLKLNRIIMVSWFYVPFFGISELAIGRGVSRGNAKHHGI